MNSLYLRGIGILVGLIFGAGVFGLPYAFSQAGIFWGLVMFCVAISIIIYLHLLYGEVAFFTKGTHRYIGYVEIYLSKTAKKLALLTTLGSYYGSLLIYGLLGGKFLNNILGSSLAKISPENFIWIFFIVAGFLVLMSLDDISSLNFYLTFPVFGFIVYLFIVALPSFRTDNLFINNGFYVKDWFLPYGVWLFSLSGFATIPETKDIFKNSSIKKFKRVIWISIIVSAIFYLIFTVAVLGVSGVNTTDDALAGISFLNKNILLVGSLIGFLAVFTSFLSLAEDMQNIFVYDYKINEITAWILTVFPPAILFFFGANDFTKILGLVGAAGMGVVGVFIILMSRSMRNKIKKSDIVQIIQPHNGDYMKNYRIVEAVVVIGIIAGIIYEVLGIFI